MSNKKDLQGESPKEERANIGTPAGESPEAGRKRHGTRCLTGVCNLGDDVRGRHVVEDEVEDADFAVGGDEISTTGGITGTHHPRARPSGGMLEGGTPGEQILATAADNVEGAFNAEEGNIPPDNTDVTGQFAAGTESGGKETGSA